MSQPSPRVRRICFPDGRLVPTVYLTTQQLCERANLVAEEVERHLEEMARGRFIRLRRVRLWDRRRGAHWAWAITPTLPVDDEEGSP